MITSWYEKAKEFKSPLRVVTAFLLRSRETQVAKNRRFREEIEELNALRDQQARRLRLQQQTIDALKQRAAELEKQRDEARQSVNLPQDWPLGTHGYGARMISLAVNVAKSVGLRGAARVLRLFFDWLGVQRSTPTKTSIRNWLQRLGIDSAEQAQASSISVRTRRTVGLSSIMSARRPSSTFGR